jgi:hypothetical protein
VGTVVVIRPSKTTVESARPSKATVEARDGTT